jgi:hypothetical protein
MSSNRWIELTEQNPEHSAWYVERFRAMAAAGDDLAGEARLIDAMVPAGHSSTPGYSDPAYPIEGRVPVSG